MLDEEVLKQLVVAIDSKVQKVDKLIIELLDTIDEISEISENLTGRKDSIVVACVSLLESIIIKMLKRYGLDTTNKVVAWFIKSIQSEMNVDDMIRACRIIKEALKEYGGEEHEGGNSRDE